MVKFSRRTQKIDWNQVYRHLRSAAKTVLHCLATKHFSNLTFEKLDKEKSLFSPTG